MPNIKSAKTRDKQSKKRYLMNFSRKSDVKSAIKKVKDALVGGDVALAQQLLKDAEAKLARAAGKRVFHKNTARRKTGRLAKRVSDAARA